jgi:hypothetical protein
LSGGVATKQFDMDRPHQYKTFGRVYFIFGNITGTGTRITLVEDGMRSQVPLALYAEVGDMGFGVDQWGTMEFGDSSGEYIGDVTGLTVRYIDLGNKDLFSLQAILHQRGVIRPDRVYGNANRVFRFGPAPCPPANG